MVVVAQHPGIPKSMRAADAFWQWVAVIVLFGGFLSLIWLPWYAPIIGCILAFVVMRANKQSAADFVALVADSDAAFKEEMLLMAVLVPKEQLLHSGDS